MCVVSAMGEHFSKKFHDWQPPQIIPLQQSAIPTDTKKAFEDYFNSSQVTRAEFDQLKKEVEEMKKILKVAAEYDAKNNEPHCEMEDKVKLLKDIAKLVGVNLDDVFPPTTMQPFCQTNIGDITGSTIATTTYITATDKVPFTYTVNTGSK